MRPATLAATVLSLGLLLSAQPPPTFAQEEAEAPPIDTARLQQELDRTFDSLKSEVQRSFDEVNRGIERRLNDRLEDIEQEFGAVTEQLRQRFREALAELDGEFEALKNEVTAAASEKVVREELKDITDQMEALREQIAELRGKTEAFLGESTTGAPTEEAKPKRRRFFGRD
jgi:DNA anti-recombination protein RmuC